MDTAILLHTHHTIYKLFQTYYTVTIILLLVSKVKGMLDNLTFQTSKNYTVDVIEYIIPLCFMYLLESITIGLLPVSGN
jgi:hypothetical protein